MPYIVEQIEYVRLNPPPKNDLFDDPEEVKRILILTKQSIEAQNG